MRKIIVLLLLSFCLTGFNFAQNNNSIDPELQQLIKQRNDNFININIILKSQIDVKKLDSNEQIYRSKKAQKDAMLREFKKFSEVNQSDVMSILNAETRSNRVRNIKSHWITNVINCEATADVIYQLSEHPDVKTVIYNKIEYMLFDEEKQEAKPTRGLTENISKVKANEVWDLGFTGKGVIVAVLDTGVNIEHEDLKDHLWDGGEEYPNHGFNTMDNNHNVGDKDGHGTHVAGIICGDGSSGTQTGVAPDATLMCIKVLGDNGEGSLDAIISGIEFSVENGADILNLSLGSRFPSMQVSSTYRTIFTNLLKLNVLGVAAAGNDKHFIGDYPVPKNINTPANCPPAWIHPDQQSVAGGTSSIISVGAVDNKDKTTYFSSEGPVTWLGSEWNDYAYDKSDGIGDEWLCYDRNYFTDNVGINGSMSWGIMFPPSKLQQYAGGKLTKISVFNYHYYNGVVNIYQGGELPEEGTLLHTQQYVGNESKSFVDIEFDSALPIDESQNLWIILGTEEGVAYPATACPMTDDPNGRWFKYNGKWGYTSDYNQNLTWLIRALIENDTDVIAKSSNEENLLTGLIRPDVVAPGFNITSTDNQSNNGYTAQSGTSMATPCVTGIVALMKEKNPNITPAEICEILETTAVKLSPKKNNTTGSGRVDALAAIQKVETPQDTTGIKENRYDNVILYPNPVGNELFLATEVQVEEIAIYDIYGRCQATVYGLQSTDIVHNIDVHDLKAGIYFVNMKTDNGNIVKRFVKK